MDCERTVRFGLESGLGSCCGVALLVVWMKLTSSYMVILVSFKVVDHECGERGAVHTPGWVCVMVYFLFGGVNRYQAKLTEGIDMFNIWFRSVPEVRW